MMRPKHFWRNGAAQGRKDEDMEKILRIICGIVAAIPIVFVVIDTCEGKSSIEIFLICLLPVAVVIWLIILGYAISGKRFFKAW